MSTPRSSPEPDVDRKRRGRRLAIAFALALVALAGVAWIFRLEILLQLVEIRQARALPVGPHREVDWQRGPDSEPAPALDGDAQVAASTAESPPRPPNIVVILADDLGWNDLTWQGGVAGGTVPTPNIDSIAREGVAFLNGYAANGTCAPSRAAIMTGRYGTRFGFEFTPTPGSMSRVVPRLANSQPGRLRDVRVNRDAEAVPFPEMGVPPSEITLAELLQSAGYHTVHIGKWHLGTSGGMAPHEQGFDESLLMASGLYLPENHPEVVNSRQPFDPIDQFLWRAMRYAASYNGGDAFEPGGYLTDWYTDQAVRVIGANRHRPFFLYLAHWAPHTPLQATRADYDALAHIDDHRLRVYAAMIRALDRGVGRVLDALEANGVDDDTLVFFTSDNGAPGYLGLPNVNRPFRGWKITFFEGGIHVPYFLRWPARLAPGQTYDAPVHGFDIFATAAAAAEVALPQDRRLDGVDLVPYVIGERQGVPHETLFWRTGPYRVVLHRGWKLQVSDPPGATWLFHLPSDPTERTNLAEREPERVAELVRLLDEHDREQAEPLWPSLLMSPISIDKTLVEPEAPDDEFIYWAN